MIAVFVLSITVEAWPDYRLSSVLTLSSLKCFMPPLNGTSVQCCMFTNFFQQLGTVLSHIIMILMYAHRSNLVT